MVNKMSLQESILNAVNIMVEQRTNDLKVDKTITAFIEKNIGKINGKTLYKLSYEGGFFEAVVLNDQEIYSPHTPVYVLIPQGNFSKEKIIIGRANNINLDNKSTTVTNAINEYTLVGGNLLYNAEKDNDKKISDLQYGVYSYHNPIEEENNPNSILHRYNLICSYNLDNNDYEESFERKDLNTTNTTIYNQNIAFNKENLDILKEQATGLMLKADFKTNLTTEQQQQAKGEYGLILNLVFNNLNKDYGATNGEVFEKVSDIVVGETYISKEQAENFNGIKSKNNNDNNDSYNYYSIKLKDVHNYYINQIKKPNDIKNNIRLLIEYTNNLKTTFSTNNTTKALYTDIVDNALIAYLSFLNELELSKTIENFNKIYNDWWTQNIGDTEDKIISYKFSSNNMIGNPLSFNRWTNQYQILNIDIKNLIRIDSIVLYKEGFIEDTDSELNWPLNNSGPDILIKNLQVYPIKPIDNENEDYTLKVQPKDLNGNSNSGILEGTDITDTVIFEAVFMRKMLENLSSNTRVSYYWFKEDFSIVDANSFGYDAMTGPGWKRISNAKSSNFITNGSNNLAYKNNYKCIARYIESENNTIVLDTTFTIYNKSVVTDILLESDLGTIFSFDAGIPEITCKINENLNDSNIIEDYQEIIAADNDIHPKYIYYWAITDSANGNKIFLNEIDNESLNESNNIVTYNSAKNIVKNIKYFKLNENLEKVPTENSIEASRINYPVNKLSSGFTVECYVKKKVSILGSNNIRYVNAGSASLEFLNRGLDIDLNSFKLIIENGNQVFQYDEYGNAPNNTSKKEPLNILPLHAKILSPSGIEIKNSNYSVEWIFPTENTMLITGETLEINPSTQVPQLHKGLSCNFDITNLYNSDYWNNQITCHVRYNNQDLYKDTEFTFTKIGENGTNGTDVVAKIHYIGNDILNTLHNEPFTIYAQDTIDEEDTTKIVTKALFNVPNIEGKLKTLSEKLSIIGDTGILDVTLFQKGKEISSDNYAATYPRWNLLGNSSYSQNYGKYFTIIRNNTGNNTNNLYNIEWDASRNTQKQLYQILKAEVQLNTGQTYYATYNIPFIWYTDKSDSILSLDHWIAIDRSSYLSSVLYNADGRNPIYNHKQGLKFINIPSNITKIVWKAKGGTDNSPCFNFISENGEILGTLYEKIGNINSEEMINILPNDIYDGGITNNYIETSFYDNKNNLIVTAYVPIYMSLNTFGLASLNAWDGNHVTVNEDEGYIMSPQIGAGEKDENNRFTGILMGKTEGEVGHTGQTDSQTGLFGYTHGIQSIFLDAKTGNATFGLPNGLHLNEKNDLEETNNFNEGRIELRPGGESTIGGWTLGNRSLYYTSKEKKDNNGNSTWEHSGELEEREKYDYIPNWKTGLIEKDTSRSYFKHHERDIKSDEAGILLYAGENPYISIKGRPFKEKDIPNVDPNDNKSEKESFIKPEDSIELQLDPATPTLFTIFRHNGGNRQGIEGTTRIDNYEKGSRTFLAGINSQGEFIANGLRNTNTTDIAIPIGDKTNQTWKAGSLVTKFAVNAINAFKDFSNMPTPKTTHVGFEITANEKDTLAHFFTKINGLSVTGEEKITNYYDPTLHISGGYTDREGEYSRPLALHGKNIQMYAFDGRTVNSEDNKFLSETDAGLKISTDEAKLQLGSTYFNLFRDTNSDNKHNTLMTANGLKINVGEEVSKAYVIEEVNIDSTGQENWISLDEQLNINKYKVFEPENCYVQVLENGEVKGSAVTRPKNKKYVNLEQVEYYLSNLKSLPKYGIVNNNYIPAEGSGAIDFYYKVKDKSNYVLTDSYENIFYKNKNNESVTNREIFKYNKSTQTYYNIEELEKINTKDLNSYYIRKMKSESEKLNEQYGYISVNDLNQNIFYTNTGSVENLIKIESIDNIYQQKWDENNNLIYLNDNLIDLNSEPFIIIQDRSNGDIRHYWKNNFDSDSLYFKLNIKNNTYYVRTFILEIEEQQENTMSLIKSQTFDANSSDSKIWYENYYTRYPDEAYIKYYIKPFFENNHRPDGNDERFEIANIDIIDFTITDSDKFGELNVYKKYVNEDSTEEYILNNDVNMSNLYYYYDEAKSHYYSNLIEGNEKRYYKCTNNNGFVEITDEGKLYFYSSEKSLYILFSNISDNFYIRTDNNEYEESMKLDNTILFKRYYIQGNYEDYKWVTLKDWLNGNSLIEYCKDVKESDVSRSSVDLASFYIYNNATKKYEKFDKNKCNYIFIEDNRNSNEPFFILQDDFNREANSVKNRWLFIQNGDTNIDLSYNIGIKNWKTENFNKQGIRLNENKILREREISKSYSDKKYIIYSGFYKNYIQNDSYFTNIDIDNTDIRMRNTRPINLFTNQKIDVRFSKNTNMSILNNKQNAISEDGKFYLNRDGAQLVCIEHNSKESTKYGFILDKSYNTSLQSKKDSTILSKNKIKITATDIGIGAVYNNINPQILLVAGENSSKNTRLILNSSNSGWNIGKTSYLSCPVFQVKTRYGDIGIIPEYVNKLYSEYFYVHMNQTIEKGLLIKGLLKESGNLGLSVANDIKAKKFIGNDWNSIFDFGQPKEGNSTVFGKGGQSISPGVGGSANFEIPKITIKATGQPKIENVSNTVKFPSASTIWAAIKNLDSFTTYMSNYLTKASASNTYAVIGHTHSEYALSGHTHSEYAKSSHTHTVPAGKFNETISIDNKPVKISVPSVRTSIS